MLPNRKMSGFVKKVMKTPKNPTVEILTQGCHASLVSSWSIPNAGRTSRGQVWVSGTHTLVLLSQQMLHLQVFCLPTGAAPHFSCITGTAFLDVLQECNGGLQTPAMKAPAVVVKLERRWKAHINSVVQDKKPERDVSSLLNIMLHC